MTDTPTQEPTGPDSRLEIIDIENEMKTSFLEYAMSVIVSRALPDVRDGLKPVHRRILFSMWDSGIRPTSTYRKSARVVGDVMGWFHPHSNDAIYDALVRMGQEHASRYPLIDPQGNFGTVDDPPAAMRYTECRLEKLAAHLLDGIDEETVDFGENYSGERDEPLALPSRYPNLLVNGSTGIAVGMATNIPPHNLGEVIDATLHVLDNPDATADDLLQYVKGPDFPTAGFILGNKGVKDALLTGRGSVKMRAVCEVEEIRKNRTAIIVTEIPYQVSRDRIMEKIAQVVREKKITGIADLRDESDRNGMRMVIELKRDAIPQVVLNQLYKLTQLQDTFGVNMVALVDGVPRTMNIAEMISHYVDHQMDVIERRTKFRLGKAEARAHIVEGLLIALDNIDEVVKIIRGSDDTDAARTSLMSNFELSEVQAQHILDMPLRRLTALETTKLRDEYDELQKLIKFLNGLLKSPAKRRKVIADELEEIREKFADDRRSRIIPDEGDLSLEDLIADEEIVITISANGYVKAVNANSYKRQGRGGRGVKGANLREDDAITRVVHTTAHSYLLFFTNLGKVHRIKAHEIPRKDRTAKGVLAQSVMPLGPDERLEAVIDMRDYETAKYLVIATKNGQIKKTEFKEYDSRHSQLIAISLRDDDEVVAVRTTMGTNEILLFTEQGMGIRFKESDVRAMGRDTQGVRGINLREGDHVVSAASDEDGEEVLILTSGGYGKRTKMSEFRAQKRGGVGVKAMKLTRVRGTLVAARAVAKGAEIFVTSSDGIVIRQGTDKISRQKRDATGVKVMDVGKDATISSFALVPQDEQNGDE
jgi:DNA gyrase subunit A